MHFLIWLVRIIVFLLLLTFTVKNSDPVTIYYYLGFEHQLPISVVLLIFFAIGMFFGYLFRRKK